jgi:hypothetical protein
MESESINNAKVIIAVTSEDRAFYDLLRKKNPDLVVTSAPSLPDGQKGTVIASSKLGIQTGLGTPASLLVNDNAKEALRWRIYTRW